jgi:hypothetical protein
MGRLHQLEKVLPVNLRESDDDVEFCLLNYNSPDGLHEWVTSNFSREIASGKLRYGFNRVAKFWNVSQAKNQARKLATGEIVVNLDADNLVGGTTEQIKMLFTDGESLIVQFFSGDYFDGTYGRIALRGEHFDQLGGYDETFTGMVVEDTDLMERAKAIGLKYLLVWNKDIGETIKNTRDDSVKFVESRKEWDYHFNTNFATMQRNLEDKRFVANYGGEWGSLESVEVFSK